MRHTDHELRSHLRSWDPARHIGDPDPRAVAAMRDALRQAAGRRRPWVSLMAAAAVTAALVTLLFLMPAVPPGPGPEASDRPVIVEFRASNGVRIHWSIYQETPDGPPSISNK